MSADNMVIAFPFRKQTNEVVWRVAEVRLSGLPYELCHMMSTEAREREFFEFSGRNAPQQADAAARRLERKMDICEYGIDVCAADSVPRGMDDLRREAIEAGYDAERVQAMVEASDSHLAKLPKGWWLKNWN